MTPKVIAEYCHVSRGTVLKWIRNGSLRAFRLPSGHYRIDDEDFKDFLNKYDMPVRGKFLNPPPGDNN